MLKAAKARNWRAGAAMRAATRRMRITRWDGTTATAYAGDSHRHSTFLARDADNLGDSAQAADDPRQMQAVVYLQREEHVGVIAAILRVNGDVLNIGPGFGDLRRYLRQHAALVRHYQLDAHVERLAGFRIPRDVENPVGLVARFRDHGAVMGVYHHALALADNADDGVSGNRLATVGELHRHAFRPADDD